MDAILSVRELTEHVRRAIEGRLPYVWVQGEVTNLSRPASGHVYFSLKEDDCLLNKKVKKAFEAGLSIPSPVKSGTTARAPVWPSAWKMDRR